LGTLKKPTLSLINRYIDKFNRDERYYRADQAIIKLFNNFPLNINLEEILLKICVLNDLYSTNIFSVFKLAKHIRSKKIDIPLSSGDPSVVHRISTGHRIKSKKRNSELIFYSFATKYCNWHNLEAYPMYDRFVEKSLMAYQKEDKFYKFKKSDLRIYPTFIEIIRAFIDFYGLNGRSLREVDKFLWIYGKEKFPAKYY
jgi:hypothetical protein